MDREDYTRVTEILSPFTGYTSAPDSVMKPYQERGTKVHAACNEIVLGHGSWLVDEDIRGYVSSFEKWWDPSWKLLEMNRRYWHDNLRLTGEVDLIVNIGNKPVLVDIKTSKKPNPTWQYQLSAYCKMVNEFNRKNGSLGSIKGLIVAQLHENGDPATILEYEYDFHTFEKCYDLYYIFFRGKRKVYEEGE